MDAVVGKDQVPEMKVPKVEVSKVGVGVDSPQAFVEGSLMRLQPDASSRDELRAIVAINMQSEREETLSSEDASISSVINRLILRLSDQLEQTDDRKIDAPVFGNMLLGAYDELHNVGVEDRIKKFKWRLIEIASKTVREKAGDGGGEYFLSHNEDYQVAAIDMLTREFCTGYSDEFEMYIPKSPKDKAEFAKNYIREHQDWIVRPLQRTYAERIDDWFLNEEGKWVQSKIWGIEEKLFHHQDNDLGDVEQNGRKLHEVMHDALTLPQEQLRIKLGENGINAEMLGDFERYLMGEPTRIIDGNRLTKVMQEYYRIGFEPGVKNFRNVFLGRLTIALYQADLIIFSGCEKRIVDLRQHLKDDRAKYVDFVAKMGESDEFIPDFASSHVFLKDVALSDSAGAAAHVDEDGLVFYTDIVGGKEPITQNDRELSAIVRHERFHDVVDQYSADGMTLRISEVIDGGNVNLTYNEVMVELLTYLPDINADFLNKIREMSVLTKPGYLNAILHLSELMMKAENQRRQEGEQNCDWRKFVVRNLLSGGKIYDGLRNFYNNTTPPPIRTFDQEMFLYSDFSIKGEFYGDKGEEHREDIATVAETLGFTGDKISKIQSKVTYDPNLIMIEGSIDDFIKI